MRSNAAARRNNVLNVVVNRHKNDPEFLARLISTGIRGQVRNLAVNYLTRIRNRAARQLSERLRRIQNVVSTSRRNRALIPHSIRITNLTPRQRLTLAEIQNFSNTGIRPIVHRLRRSPANGIGMYSNPHTPGYRYRLTNNGNLMGVIGAHSFKIASGVRRRNGGRRLEY
jgi:hypothetical protein